ncbi:MAG: hypothetical protein ACEPOV_10895 [Hyphomicrobiales bacterium]
MEHTVYFSNKSTMSGSICIYLSSTDSQKSDVYSSIWISKYVHSQVNVVFKWDPIYSFCWTELLSSKSGVQVGAFQAYDTDLSESNLITLDYDKGFYFENKRKEQNTYLNIDQDVNVPNNRGYCGLGMSSFPAILTNTHPNIKESFDPKVIYNMVFGNYERGELHNITSFSNTQELDFPSNDPTLSIILNERNQWEVQQGRSKRIKIEDCINVYLNNEPNLI